MTEQDEWEKNQQAMTQFAIGAQDKKKEGDEYDFVTETEIEFVEDLQRKGVNVEDLIRENEKKEELMKNAKSDFEKIQIQRASLPVTQCKEQILEYIKNNNIQAFARKSYELCAILSFRPSNVRLSHCAHL